jgi:hypothetical protein
MTTIQTPSDTSTVAGAIDTYAPNALVNAAMRLGALLEGGSLGPGPFGVGDSGHSHGPFQINDLYHSDITAAAAEDPAAAVQYMLPSYEGALRKVPLSLWKSDPELAAEQTAFFAERPAQDYITRFGQSTVDQKWQTATGVPPTTGGGAGGGQSGWSKAWDTFTKTLGVGLDLSNPVAGAVDVAGGAANFADDAVTGIKSVSGFLNNPKPFALTVGAILAGGALIVAGLWRSVSRTQTAQTVGQALPAAAASSAL